MTRLEREKVAKRVAQLMEERAYWRNEYQLLYDRAGGAQEKIQRLTDQLECARADRRKWWERATAFKSSRDRWKQKYERSKQRVEEMRAEVRLQRSLRQPQRRKAARSEEHTSELQSLRHLVCR